MTTQTHEPSDFRALVDEITTIGLDYHRESITKNALYNKRYAENSVKSLPKLEGEKARHGIVISAGPSVKRTRSIERIRDAGYKGSIVSTDGGYVACLRAGLVPDYVICLDPHPTRIVRWFGDPDIEKHSANDDYFERQDLNADFRGDSLRKNAENIELVNKHAAQTKVIVATTVHATVTDRLRAAGLQTYWWNPLVDDPTSATSITKQLFEINKIPCMNTGGTVGTAAWIFMAAYLKLPLIGVVGMDYGYHGSTPFEQTQTYYELLHRNGGKEGIERFFVKYKFDLTGDEFYTDPTYYWYRRNFLELFEKIQGPQTFNCTEGGTLMHERIPRIYLDEYFRKVKA